MTLRQWLCGKILGHKWQPVQCEATILEQDRIFRHLTTSRQSVIEFDVCTRCGLESDFEEVTHDDQSGL